MYDQNAAPRKPRSTTKPDYDFLGLPELWLFVEYGEAEAVELEVGVSVTFDGRIG